MMKNNFKKLLNKYSFFKHSFLKDLRLRKQKIKSIWIKANTLKSKKIIKNSNLDKFQNLISKIDLTKLSFLKKFKFKSSKNNSIKKVKAVTKARFLDEFQNLYKKSFKNISLRKYRISPKIFKNYFKSKLLEIEFKNIEIFLDKYLSPKFTNYINLIQY